MMQHYCRLLGVRATEPELHDLAATVGALADDHPISAITQRAADFRRADALADTLLNPRERAYAVPEVYAWLERCGLVFARWVEQAPSCRNAARSRACRTPRVSARSRYRRSTRPSNSCAER